MDSGGQAPISQNEILQNSPESKNHVKTIISEDWKQTVYSRPSVIRRLGKSSVVDTNVNSWPLSDSTGLQHESKGGALSFPLNIQEEDLPVVIPLSKKKLENCSGRVLLHGEGNASQLTAFGEPTSSKHKDEDETEHLSSRSKRRTTQARAGESDQGKDESSVLKQEGRNVYLSPYNRKRTIAHANIGDDSTVFKQALAYGKRSKRQAFPATPWPFQKHDERIIRRTSFKREECGACAPVRHLLCLHGKRTIPECPSMSAACKQEERSCKILPPPPIIYRNQILPQSGLDEKHQRYGSYEFKQESENTTGNAQWCCSRKKTSIDGSNEYEDEGGIGHLPWLNRKRTAKRFHDIGETQQREGQSEAAKNQDKEPTVHPQWPNGRRTAKRYDIGETQQREGETLNKQEKGTTVHLPLFNGRRTIKQSHDLGEPQENVIKKPPNYQNKNPDEHRGTDTLDYDPVLSRKVDHGAPSYSKDFEPMKQHAVGCSNAPRGFTGITGTTCPICYKTMSRSYHLKSHMLIHSGEKPFKCAYCDKSFNQIGNRNAHQRIHTGEKPYACEHCGKRFVFVSSKHNHLKMHLLMRQERQHLPTK